METAMYKNKKNSRIHQQKFCLKCGVELQEDELQDEICFHCLEQEAIEEIKLDFQLNNRTGVVRYE